MPATDSSHVAKFKELAKSLHKAVKARDPDALTQVEPYFKDPVGFKLTQAQLVIARTLKCQSWKKLVDKDDWVNCSFCKKWQYETRNLIGGPDGVFVCDECVSLCNEIIREDRQAS